MRYLLALLLCVSCQVTGAGTGHDAASRGNLLIVGGGLQADNAEVLGAFATHAQAISLVIPTASGVPTESAQGTLEMLTAFAAPGQSMAPLSILAIHHDTPERAQDQSHVDAIHQATAVWFTGGQQSRIIDVFRPAGQDSPAYDALQQLLARDGLIAGTSAGAAMMSDPMIASGSSEAALLQGAGLEGSLAKVAGDSNPPDPTHQASQAPSAAGVKLAQGMGFFPYGLVDQHFLSRGRFGRLIVAMEATGHDIGLGIADNRALLVDLSEASGTALGNHAVVLIDLSTMTREGASRLGIHISLASNNDSLNFTTAKVHPAQGKPELAQRQHIERQPDASQAPQLTALTPWSKEALAILLQRLAVNPSQPQTARNDKIEITLSAAPETKFWSTQNDLSDLTVSEAILDIILLP
jgi:cyanophycinase